MICLVVNPPAILFFNLYWLLLHTSPWTTLLKFINLHFYPIFFKINLPHFRSVYNINWRLLTFNKDEMVRKFSNKIFPFLFLPYYLRQRRLHKNSRKKSLKSPNFEEAPVKENSQSNFNFKAGTKCIGKDFRINLTGLALKFQK